MGNISSVQQTLMTQLETLHAQRRATVASLVSPAHAAFVSLGLGVLPGRAVVDSVTGQIVTVVGGGVQNVTLPAAEGGSSGG